MIRSYHLKPVNQANASINTQKMKSFYKATAQGFLATLLGLEVGSSFFFFDRLLPPLGL